MKEKIVKTDNGINIKIVSENLCCIYGNENSCNYFIKKEYLEEALSKKWE